MITISLFLLAGLALCVLSESLYTQTAEPTDAFRYVLPLEGRYLNDHCLVRGPDSLWHLFGIVGTISKYEWKRDGNEILIGHFTSPDLLRWKEHEPAITIGEEGSYDDGHVYAPYVIYREGMYNMYYTATDTSHYSPERICLAQSKDLFTWFKHTENPIFVPDSSWAAYYPPWHLEGTGPMSCRDPHVMYHPEHGYIMYYIARLKDTPTEKNLACIAAATSSDMVTWSDRGPILVREVFGEEEFTWSHPESPCVVERDGRFYLFWKGANGMHFAMSKDPLDFRYANSYFLATSHASEIVNWDGTWYITSCSREPDDLNHTTDRMRGLYLARLAWDERWPRLRSLDSIPIFDEPVPLEKAAETP